MLNIPEDIDDPSDHQFFPKIDVFLKRLKQFGFHAKLSFDDLDVSSPPTLLTTGKKSPLAHLVWRYAPEENALIWDYFEVCDELKRTQSGLSEACIKAMYATAASIGAEYILIPNLGKDGLSFWPRMGAKHIQPYTALDLLSAFSEATQSQHKAPIKDIELMDDWQSLLAAAIVNNSDIFQEVWGEVSSSKGDMRLSHSGLWLLNNALCGNYINMYFDCAATNYQWQQAPSPDLP